MESPEVDTHKYSQLIFDKDNGNTMDKTWSFQQTVLELDMCMQKKKKVYKHRPSTLQKKLT